MVVRGGERYALEFVECSFLSLNRFDGQKNELAKIFLKNFFALQTASRGSIASRFILCISSDTADGIAVFWLLCRSKTSVQASCFAQSPNEHDLRAVSRWVMWFERGCNFNRPMNLLAILVYLAVGTTLDTPFGRDILRVSMLCEGVPIAGFCECDHRCLHSRNIVSSMIA